MQKEWGILTPENLFWIGFVGAVLAIAFAYVQSRKVMTFSEGSDTMKKIAASIREGANAYLRRQYTTVAKVFVVVFVILLVIAFASNGEMLSKFTPFAFITGGMVHVGRFCRHEDCHQFQCPHRAGRLREPQ